MSMRIKSILASLLSIASWATLVQAGPLPDIRGKSFDHPFFGSEVEGATFDVGFGPFILETDRTPGARIPIPHTFDVVADPSAPGDPTRIVIQTRLGFDPSAPLPAVLIDLTGTYDRITGAIHASGTNLGVHLDDLGTDTSHSVVPFDADVILSMVDPTLSLNGVLSVGPSSLTITGTDPVTPIVGPGNLSFTGDFLVSWLPVGDVNLNDAFVTLDGTNPYGGIYGWTATAVPEPGTLTLAGMGVVLLIGQRWRRWRQRK